MKYPNAYKGVKTLVKAMALNIAASVLFLLSALLFVAAGINLSEEQIDLNALNTTVIIGIALATLGALIISLVSFILQIIGLKRGMKDEPLFKTALVYVFVGLASTFASSLMTGMVNSQLTDSFKILSEVSTLLISLYIIFALRSLAQKLGNSKIDFKGKALIWVLISVFLMTIVSRIIGISSSELSSVLSALAAVFDLIGYCLFLIYLIQSKKCSPNLPADNTHNIRATFFALRMNNTQTRLRSKACGFVLKISKGENDNGRDQQQKGCNNRLRLCGLGFRVRANAEQSFFRACAH